MRLLLLLISSAAANPCSVYGCLLLLLLRLLRRLLLLLLRRLLLWLFLRFAATNAADADAAGADADAAADTTNELASVQYTVATTTLQALQLASSAARAKKHRNTISRARCSISIHSIAGE